MKNRSATVFKAIEMDTRTLYVTNLYRFLNSDFETGNMCEECTRQNIDTDVKTGNETDCFLQVVTIRKLVLIMMFSAGDILLVWLSFGLLNPGFHWIVDQGKAKKKKNDLAEKAKAFDNEFRW